MYKVTPLSQPQKDWKIAVNGTDVTDTTLSLVMSSRWGELSFGATPYPSWKWRETGGGGSVTIPYVWHPTGELLIGLIREDRPNMGGLTLCAIGGMVEPNETHRDAQTRESFEESGISTQNATLLPGEHVTLNRLFDIVTPGEGVHMYSIEIQFGELIAVGDEWRMKTGTLSHKREADIVFFPWKKSVRLTRDACALSAIAKLVTEVL